MAEPAKKSTPAKKAAVVKKSPTAKKGTPAKKSPTAKKRTPAKKAAAVKKSPTATKAPRLRKTDATAREKAANAMNSKFFKRAVDRARRISDDPRKLREIADKANDSTALRSGPLAAVLDDLQALIRLVVAYARGLYREIPADRLVVVVAGLIYVVSPVDLIPDAIPGVGLLDDVTVIAWVIKAVRDELDAFRKWETGMTD